MQTIPKDPYNVVVKENKKCAYNYQGQVRLGRITAIRATAPKASRPWQTTYDFVISVKEEMTGRISKVGNPKNLVILPG